MRQTPNRAVPLLDNVGWVERSEIHAGHQERVAPAVPPITGANVLTATLLLATLCGLPLTAPSQAQQAPPPAAAKSSEQVYYERLIRKIEPDLVGKPERLPLYVQLFGREMINDSRLFPFDVEAEWSEEGTVVLSGFVGFEENRSALFKFLHYLGFDAVDDRIEVLPSKELGPQRFGFVKARHTFSFDRPAGRKEVLTDCLLGAPLFLLKEAADGFFLCHAAEGYVGYVDGSDVRRADREEFARYRGGAQVYVRRDYEIPDGFSLPAGARLKYVGSESGDVIAELPSGIRAVVPRDCCHVRDGGPNPRIERVIENASRLVGTKYLWGGNTSSGIDCSGLVQTSFAAEGINLPRDSNQQVYLGSLVATRWYRDGLRRGDTLYFLGSSGKISHTAIYLGEGQYLESVRPVVRITSFHAGDENYDPRRDAALAFGRRLLE